MHGGVRETGWGHQWMNRHVSMTLLYMHEGFFPPRMQKQMRVISHDDVTDVLLIYI